MNEDFLELLEKIADESDVDSLDGLVKTLTVELIRKYKSEICGTYMSIYSDWHCALVCEKIREGDEAGFLFAMIDIINSIERIDQEVIRYRERAVCYEMLAQYAPEIPQQILYYQKAIDIYRDAVQYPEFAGLNASIAAALLEKMSIEERFDGNVFNEVISLFDKAYAEYSKIVLRNFICTCFDILRMPFDEKELLHKELFSHFIKSTDQFAQKDNLIYLTWSHELTLLLYNDYYPVSDIYADELNYLIIALLQHLTDYETDEQSILNQLGSEFEKAAGRLKESPVEKLPLYETALKYFIAGQRINPFTWTFPVYATKVLKEMAFIYFIHDRWDEMIGAFENGRKIFAENPEPDFTLTLNWGRFLLGYAKLAYDFDAPYILDEAEEKLLIAKELGENYYSEPFILLAKIALKRGDADRCISLLKECKNIFSNEYYTYPLDDVLADDDFEEVHQQISEL